MNTNNNPKRLRLVTVQHWYDISPNLRRIIFHSPELADYPFRNTGAHIKIFLALPEQTYPELPLMTDKGPQWQDKTTAPFKRSYTLSEFDKDNCTLSIDFVLHGDNGPASAFAEKVQKGKVIGISSPTHKEPFPNDIQSCLMVGDLSALPAITAILSNLPLHTQGDVLLWLPSQADFPIAIQKPDNINLHCFTSENSLRDIVQHFKQCRPSHENAYLWIAGEMAMVNELRYIARQQWQIDPHRCYAVPFWHQGESEEQYHQQRHAFMDKH